MQIDIRYETNGDADFPCCARTEVQGRDYFGIGKSWEQAKENLLKKLDAKLGTVAPPPETVEVKVAGEEMDTEFFPFDAGNTRKDIEGVNMHQPIIEPEKV